MPTDTPVVKTTESRSSTAFLTKRYSQKLFERPVAEITLAEGRSQALHHLNHRDPEHVPDVYFVRRSPNLLKEYLKKDAE